MSVTQESTGKQLYFFVRRPVLAAVISIVIVLLGTFALIGLPVARYPQITPPSVQVSATHRPSWHTCDPQSSDWRQFKPSLQAGQAPPQSTSLSLPFTT